jgi:hypothetical protein
MTELGGAFIKITSTAMHIHNHKIAFIYHVYSHEGDWRLGAFDSRRGCSDCSIASLI